jgi:phosphoenolpyruvate-protein kinase (PTS system EI component)
VLELEVAEPVSEPNPELGMHGSRRIAQDVSYQKMIRILTSQLRADAITWSIPFINDEFELRHILGQLRVTDAHRWGAFVETPAAVCQLPRMLDTGVSVVNVGTKDLVQFVLAADRNNHAVAHVYDTRHPAVMSALSAVVNHCAGYDVVLRIFALGKDLDYYRSWLPPETRFMLCASELIEIASPV